MECLKLARFGKNFREFVLFSILAFCLAQPHAQAIVILKLDDFGYSATAGDTGIPAAWLAVYDYLKGEGLVAGFGLIAHRLQNATPAHCAKVQQMVADGFKIWHHGWDHGQENGKKDFFGYPYDRQKTHFYDAMNIAKEKYGITMRSVGAQVYMLRFACAEAVSVSRLYVVR